MTLKFIPPTSFLASLVKDGGFERHRPIQQLDTFEIHYLDLTPLKLKVSPFTPFLLSKSLGVNSEISTKDLQAVLAKLADIHLDPTSGAFLVLGGTLKNIDRSVWADATKSGIVILHNNHFASAVSSKDPKTLMRVLSAALLRTFGTLRLSPYHSRIPAVGGTFFGRAQILKQAFLVNDNFTFVGNRRIGKTSLLQEIKHRLMLQKDQPVTAELYGSRCRSTSDALSKILRQIDPKAADKAQADLVEHFPQKVKQLARERRIVVFIDEFDRLIDMDEAASHELMDSLREAFYQTENTRLYTAGFRSVRRAMQDVKSPLYGFTSRIVVGPLSSSEAREMIEAPLLNLGIDVRATPLSSLIYNETAGHPELVQICCSEIIKSFDERKKIPDPTDLLSAVFRTEDFRERVFGAFFANTNQHEKLVSYLLMRLGLEKGGDFGTFDFDLKDIDRLVKDTGFRLTVDQLYEIWHNLVLCGIFVEIQGGARLRFSVPQLAKYCQNCNLDFMIQNALEGAKQERGIWSDSAAITAETSIEKNDKQDS